MNGVALCWAPLPGPEGILRNIIVQISSRIFKGRDEVVLRCSFRTVFLESFGSSMCRVSRARYRGNVKTMWSSCFQGNVHHKVLPPIYVPVDLCLLSIS